MARRHLQRQRRTALGGLGDVGGLTTTPAPPPARATNPPRLTPPPPHAPSTTQPPVCGHGGVEQPHSSQQQRCKWHICGRGGTLAGPRDSVSAGGGEVKSGVIVPPLRWFPT